MRASSAENQVPPTSRESAGHRSRLAAFAYIPPVLSWLAIYVARRVTAGPFNETGANTMILLLIIGAALTVAGLVLSILGLRARDSNHLLALGAVVLNCINFVFYLFIGLLALFISL